MQVNKNQIEAVRYQLKKLNTTSTNEEIRLTANGFNDFDAVLIANQIVANKTQSLVIGDDVATEDLTEVKETLITEDDDSAIAPLATTTKNELIANTAGELGIVLNTREIELIAQNVNYSSDDLQESLEEIKSAIIAFVRHKIALNSQKIGETLEEITQVATDGFSQNSQQLTDG
ncbi:MAG: hypothetical protein ACKPCI_13915, partial [Dolichospermum sp.]